MARKRKTPEELSKVRAEAGHKGGGTTLARHGKDYFSRIGALGGYATGRKRKRKKDKESSQNDASKGQTDDKAVDNT